MKKVKFTGDSRYYNYANLVKNKIYDVSHYISDDIEIHIIVEGKDRGYYITDIYNRPVFEDVTAEVRSNLIDEILL